MFHDILEPQNSPPNEVTGIYGCIYTYIQYLVGSSPEWSAASIGSLKPLMRLCEHLSKQARSVTPIVGGCLIFRIIFPPPTPKSAHFTFSTWLRKKSPLRAKGTLISEPRFFLPAVRCDFSHARKGKRPFQRKTLDKGHFPFLAWEKSHLAAGRKSGLTN